ncbi:MAG: hypothetical protein KatS3mg002_0366 [Candidatus Woesearchaeota archaeon]|nr:MAG: hypothetical protein KatS3mg002_0366 [Candidatus Woesearchaeota archaeon]
MENYIKEHVMNELSKIGYMVPLSLYREKFVPSYTVVNSIRDFQFYINNIDKYIFYKGKDYVVPTGIYYSLKRDEEEKKIKFVRQSKKSFEKLYRPYNGEDVNGKYLLISRLGGIGDLIYIQPAINIIKRRYPNSKIIFATRPSFHLMVQSWESVDNVITFPFTLNALIKSDYHGIFEGVIERTLESKYLNAYELFARWLGLNDLTLEDLMPYQKPDDNAIQYCKSILDEWGIKEKEFIIIQKRASALNRTPPDEFWIPFINELEKFNLPIVITDEPSMKNIHDQFIKKLSNKNVFNFSMHSKNIYFSVALTFLAKAAICPDTSMIPISTSVRVPCFHIHGAYPPVIRQSPIDLYTESIMGEAECGPCFKMAWEECDRTCYFNLDINECLVKMEKLLEKAEIALELNKEMENAA